MLYDKFKETVNCTEGRPSLFPPPPFVRLTEKDYHLIEDGFLSPSADLLPFPPPLPNHLLLRLDRKAERKIIYFIHIYHHIVIIHLRVHNHV